MEASRGTANVSLSLQASHPWVHLTPMNSSTHNPTHQSRGNEVAFNEIALLASLKSSLWTLPSSLMTRS